MKKKIIITALGFISFIGLTSLTDSASRPFWGEVCVDGGIGVSPDGTQCIQVSVCTKYRFWINFGYTTTETEVPCPR
jgi:hypothetical protein